MDLDREALAGTYVLQHFPYDLHDRVGMKPELLPNNLFRNPHREPQHGFFPAIGQLLGTFRSLSQDAIPFRQALGLAFLARLFPNFLAFTFCRRNDLAGPVLRNRNHVTRFLGRLKDFPFQNFRIRYHHLVGYRIGFEDFLIHVDRPTRTPTTTEGLEQSRPTAGPCGPLLLCSARPTPSLEALPSAESVLPWATAL